MIFETFRSYRFLIQTKLMGTALPELFGSYISNVIHGSTRRGNGLGQGTGLARVMQDCFQRQKSIQHITVVELLLQASGFTKTVSQNFCTVLLLCTFVI